MNGHDARWFAAVMRPSRWRRRFGLFATVCCAAAGALSGCTEAAIVKPTEESGPVFDNKLDLSGRFCTSDPNDLKFPVKVLFIIDTSQSMNVSDPVQTNVRDLTRATGRSRSIREVITKFIDLRVKAGTKYCNTGTCAKGKQCAACGTNAICVGPDCCKSTVASRCKGVPACPAATTNNGYCLPLCDVKKTGCRPGEKNCADCPNPGDFCLKGICGKQLDPGVEFAIMRFGSAKQVLTRDANKQPGFTNDPAELVTSLPQVNNGGSVTDYEGALSEAFSLLAKDMRKVRDEDRAALNRTKYVVVFLSDGAPYPRVNEEDDWDSVPSSIVRDLIGQLAGSGQTVDDLTSIIDKYNIPNKILQRVKDIMSLKAVYRVGGIKLHTAFLSSGSPASVEDQAIGLLKQMSKIGKGTFRNFKNGEEINFLHVDFSSLKRVFRVKNFIVSNENARPVAGKTVTDSDGDGIDDAREDRAGTDVVKLDTDGDGFSDTVEYFFRASGWDALDPADASCALKGDQDGDGKPDDADGDGLHDCEERFLGTNAKQFDSDGDGIPDGLEVRFGTNPVTNDILEDLDFDGMPNGSEIRLHTDVRGDDAAHRSRISYRYDVKRTGTGKETVGLTCTKDSDCPQGSSGSCNQGYCRCSTANDCSSLKACKQDPDCTITGETCVNKKCASKQTCQALENVTGAKVCAQEKNITCYTFDVANIQLVSRGKQSSSSALWNTIYLYVGETPFDKPNGFGNFVSACVKARYNAQNGNKLPLSGALTLPESAWKLPDKLDPSSDCVCPDGKIGACTNAKP